MKKLAVCLVAAALFANAAALHVPIETFKLPNGLRVVLSRDNTAPVVAVYLIYGVGARSEQKGRSGFAHLFEHMMFEGSQNVPKGEIDRLVEGNGGNMNGSTHPDFTDYFEVLPSNKLAMALWLESDRMRALNITEENLTNQKEAVKQERRLSFDNRPYATAIVDQWPQLAYRNWGNSHSLIGSFEDLNAATIEDVRQFFKTHYAPNNAVLVIAGDFQTADVKKLISTYFADIPSQPQPHPPDLTEPQPPQAKSETVKDPLAQVPALVVGWPGPTRRSDDFYALEMLDVVLTGGDSSRFQQELVKGKQSIISYEAELGWPFAETNDYVAPGMYAIQVMYKPNFTGDQILGQIGEEIEKIKKDGVPAAELERARTFYRAARYNALQSTLGVARTLGQYELFDRDPNLINTELEKYMAVTSDQIKAAANKYLAPDRRVVLNILPAPKAEGKKVEGE
jgi:predicted Zn-dependent peptidase